MHWSVIRDRSKRQLVSAVQMRKETKGLTFGPWLCAVQYSIADMELPGHVCTYIGYHSQIWKHHKKKVIWFSSNYYGSGCFVRFRIILHFLVFFVLRVPETYGSKPVDC